MKLDCPDYPAPVKAPQPANEPDLDKSQPVINWPADGAIKTVSEQLAQLKCAGIRLAAGGDHFRSGDLAYQLQETIRSTAALFRRIQRVGT